MAPVQVSITSCQQVLFIAGAVLEDVTVHPKRDLLIFGDKKENRVLDVSADTIEDFKGMNLTPNQGGNLLKTQKALLRTLGKSRALMTQKIRINLNLSRSLSHTKRRPNKRSSCDLSRKGKLRAS